MILNRREAWRSEVSDIASSEVGVVTAASYAEAKSKVDTATNIVHVLGLGTFEATTTTVTGATTETPEDADQHDGIRNLVFEVSTGVFKLFKRYSYRKRKIYYPEDYGAVPYDSVSDAKAGTDSRTALMTLLASMPTLGGEICVSGLYGLNSSIDLRTSDLGRIFRGIGGGVPSGFVAQSDTVMTTIDNSPSLTPPFAIEFHDVWWEGHSGGTQKILTCNDAFIMRFINCYSAKGGTGFEFQNVGDLVIQNLISECPNSLIIGGASSSRVNLSGLNLIPPTGYGIKISGSVDRTVLLSDSNISGDSQAAGSIGVWVQGDNLSAVNLEVRDFETGITLEGQRNRIASSRIHDNDKGVLFTSSNCIGSRIVTSEIYDNDVGASESGAGTGNKSQLCEYWDNATNDYVASANFVVS